MPLGLHKECLALKNFNLVVGVDEAGRGPIAGPVCCGAFAFISPKHPDIGEYPYSAIADSKQIAEEDREEIFNEIIHIARTGRPLHKQKPVKKTPQGSAKEETSIKGEIKEECTTQANSPGESTIEACGDSDQQTPSVNQENENQCPQKSDRSVDIQSTRDNSVDSENEEVKDRAIVDLDQIVFTSDSPFAFAMSKSEPVEIDTLNILNATLLSMARAVYKLVAALPPGLDHLRIKVLVDGNRMPPYMSGKPKPENIPPGLSSADWENAMSRVKAIEAETIIKGDSSVFSIAAASIIAKVTRDRLLRDLATRYPQYELEVHKGYPTPCHKSLVSHLGPSEIHRLSFEPCYSLLKNKAFPVPESRDFKSIQDQKEAKKSKGKRSKDTATLEASQPKLKLVRRAS